jgi:2-C-methyl-D-erythritol 2,4-cyclodiphosphate synthase
MTGIGYDSHRFEDGRRLMLGGIHVPFERGLAGHSDADVLTHAVIDAVLGASNLGDIGKHFPDTDERWKDADSIEMLREVARMIPGPIVHVDATVICEAPKLGPFREEMERTLAEASGAQSVNVKFTTNEGMGFVGRGEGIAALAVATVGTA